MNPIYDNIITRRSVRVFTKKHIESEDLHMIVKAGIYAPSGMNRQSWRFTVIQNEEKIQQLAAAVAEELNRDKNYDFYRPNAIVLVSNDKDNSNGFPDCACALENMFLMAHSLGIGSCWINQLKTICDAPKIRSLLNEYGIPENHIVWGIAALGYARMQPEAKQRDESVIHFVD